MSPSAGDGAWAHHTWRSSDEGPSAHTPELPKYDSPPDQRAVVVMAQESTGCTVSLEPLRGTNSQELMSLHAPLSRLLSIRLLSLAPLAVGVAGRTAIAACVVCEGNAPQGRLPVAILGPSPTGSGPQNL